MHSRDAEPNWCVVEKSEIASHKVDPLVTMDCRSTVRYNSTLELEDLENNIKSFPSLKYYSTLLPPQILEYSFTLLPLNHA